MGDSEIQVARPLQVAVIGDSEADRDKYLFAETLGRSLAKVGYTVITGGRGGVMEAVNKGAYEAGGISIGILPSEQICDANRYCNVVIPTGIGHARNVLTVLAANAIVSIGGGAGTLSEISFGWIHKKPVFAFSQFDGWSAKLAGRQLDARFSEGIEAVSSISDLLSRLRKLQG
jgi:uncharacterized protein (TIGR00725 family)